MKFYDTLKIEFAACPPDCRECEQACPEIRTVHLPEVNFHAALTCLQCGQPRCLEVCPTGAISRNEEDGVVYIDEEKCLGCALCTLACPYGGIRCPPGEKAAKCDYCKGKPKCLDACRFGVLSYWRPGAILDYFKEEDRVAPGTSLCPGCPAELALRLTLRILGRDIVLFGAPGCAALITSGFGTQATVRVPTVLCLLDNVPAMMTGVSRFYRKQGREIRTVAFVGDGATADVGFQSLSGSAERGENLLYICYDNEGYMNTGIQRSGTTPYGAWTTTTPVGKKQRAKNVPLLLAFHGAAYVATATVAFLEDYARKLSRAMEATGGLAYIHLFSPCPTGWRAPGHRALEISRMAVETNFFPLWEAERGKFRLTYEPARPRPVAEFTRLMGKYAHLSAPELESLQQMVDEQFRAIKALASL